VSASWAYEFGLDLALPRVQRRFEMPEKETVRRARKDKAEGKAASSQAGEFVREEIHHIREGKHGARSTKQAIAIGLSKARRAGVNLKAPEPGTTSRSTRQKAARDVARGHGTRARRPSAKRAKATKKALKREGHAAASPQALSRQAHSAASKRSSAARSTSARKAVRTKGPAARSRAAKKAARTRAARA
jgi:hypothetical protein